MGRSKTQETCKIIVDKMKGLRNILRILRLKTSLWIILIALIATSFAHASEAVEASEALSTESLIENSVEAEITPWLNPVAENFLEPDVLIGDNGICDIDENFESAILDLLPDGTLCGDVTADDLGSISGVNGVVSFSELNIAELNATVTQAFNNTSLLQFYLNKNVLSEIPPAAFANLADLTNLYLHENQITDVGEDAFANMSKLQRIALRDNSLTEIPANLYSNLESLQLLYLYNNKIASVAVDAFADLPMLDKLRLYNNSIAELPLGVFDGVGATEIDLSDNELSSLPLNLLQNHTNPSSIEIFNIADNPVADGDGWEITDAAWQNTGKDFEYRLSIGHALPADLTVTFTVVNGTVAGTSEVTITKGSTTSDTITVSPTLNTRPFSLISHLTEVAEFSGHIGSTTLQADSTYCGSDPDFTKAILGQISGVTHCSFITKADLTGLKGLFLIFSASISAINPAVTQALTGISYLAINNNDITAIPAASFANLTGLGQSIIWIRMK